MNQKRKHAIKSDHQKNWLIVNRSGSQYHNSPATDPPSDPKPNILTHVSTSGRALRPAQPSDDTDRTANGCGCRAPAANGERERWWVVSGGNKALTEHLCMSRTWDPPLKASTLESERQKEKVKDVIQHVCVCPHFSLCHTHYALSWIVSLFVPLVMFLFGCVSVCVCSHWAVFVWLDWYRELRQLLCLP